MRRIQIFAFEKIIQSITKISHPKTQIKSHKIKKKPT